MKTAIITSKNEFGQIVNEGEAILGSKMDSRADQGFYEYKFIGDSTTHCGWITDSSIREEKEGDL